MLKYHEYEKAVYDWLMSKREKDADFTFSLRKKIGKGQERDIFIGTENSKYFATTFWSLRIDYPGSSGEATGIIFKLGKEDYSYFIELNQTNKPHNEQNEGVLRSLKKIFSKLPQDLKYSGNASNNNAMFNIKILPINQVYYDLNIMFDDIDKQLAILVPIIDEVLAEEKLLNPNFIGQRITNDEFAHWVKKLENRNIISQNSLNDVLANLGEVVTENYFSYLRKLIADLGLDVTSQKIYFNYEKDTLIFGIGQYYAFNVSVKGFYRLMSKYKGSDAVEFAEEKAYLNNYPMSENIEVYYSDLLMAAKDILALTNKSGYFKFDRKDFRAKVFDTPEIIISKLQLQHNMSLNQILYGPPGTGKTYHTINKALSIIEQKSEDKLEQETREALKERYQNYVANGQIVFTTFHQSMSYEDFVEGIKPQTVNEKVVYEVEPGIFKLISDKARGAKGNFDDVLDKFKIDVNQGVREKALTIKSKSTYFDIEYRGTNVFYIQPHNSSKENPWYPVNIENIRKVFDTGSYDKVYNATYVREIISYWEKAYNLKKSIGSNEEPYILIIDEINRGNVSAIFGELITLIEESKRAGASEALELTLPYSKEKFSVPSNLYIIGTMNTADRSVEALDTALRRRFAFEEMMPEPYKITKDGALAESDGVLQGIDLAAVLTKINERIAILLNVDHQIGHSYLINVFNTQGLANAFNNCIVPLLKEYFYYDDEKIALVLGGGFVNVKTQTENIQAIFPVMKGLEVHSIENKSQFEFKPITSDTIIHALETLLSGG